MPLRPGNAGDPRNGPWNRDLVAYRSTDGIAFGAPTTFVERAGVPSVIRDTSGRLLAVFQWFPFENATAFDRVAMVASNDDGRTWAAPTAIEIVGLSSDLVRPFDPTLVQLPDGRYRIYFTSNARSGASSPAIYSAVSDDAVRFRVEDGTRFAPTAGTVDAAVVLFDGTWHLYAHNQQANTGRGFHATSTDGLVFVARPDVDVGPGRQWIGNAVVTRDALRYYGSGANGVWSARSTNGESWVLDAGVRVVGGDASAVVLASGETLLLAVGPLRADAGPAPR